MTVANQKTAFVFEPDRYTGKKQPGRRAGRQARPEDGLDRRCLKGGQGSRLRLGDVALFDRQATRRGPRRLLCRLAQVLQARVDAAGLRLEAARRGDAGFPGRRGRSADFASVQARGRVRSPARPASGGTGAGIAVSRWKWDLGIVWYEETRDSGANFFFEQLPAGEYTFRYRLRANMAGTFKVGPATVQSMYAPEFAAYSAGNTIRVGP